jgi:hypothetical protein
VARATSNSPVREVPGYVASSRGVSDPWTGVGCEMVRYLQARTADVLLLFRTSEYLECQPRASCTRESIVRTVGNLLVVMAAAREAGKLASAGQQQTND